MHSKIEEPSAIGIRVRGASDRGPGRKGHGCCDESKEKIFRWDEDVERIGVSKSSIRRWIENGEFPAPMKLGGPRSRAVGWRAEDIDRWIEGLATA